MLSKLKALSWLSSVVLLLAGCQQPKDNHVVKSVHVDCSEVKEFNLKSDLVRAVNVGITENVRDVLLQDDKIILRYENSISAYDLATGDSLYSCSRRGRRDDEFISLTDAWLKGDQLELYDFNSSKILRFDSSSGVDRGSVMGLENKHKFTTLRWEASKDRYVGFMTFSQDPTVDLAEYDSSYRFVKEIESPIKKSGTYFVSPISQAEDGSILYHRAYERMIYKVKDYTLEPEYELDFGENQMPESFVESHTENEISKFWGQNKGRYVSFNRDLQESESSLCFSCRLSLEVLFVRYDKVAGQSSVYRFIPGGDQPSAKIISYHGVIYVVTQEESGTVIYMVDEKVLT